MSARRQLIPEQRQAQGGPSSPGLRVVHLPHVPQGELPAPGPEYLPSVAERRAAERLVAERLLVEFERVRSAGAVVRTVLACAHELRGHGVEHGLEPALEAMARSRLAGDDAGGPVPPPGA